MSKGYWVEDPFNSFIKGHSLYESTTKDLMQLSKEVDGFRHAAFPPYSEAFDSRYFINFADKNIENILNGYFLGDTRSKRQFVHYRDHFEDLSNFFSDAIYDLLIYGCHYAVIDWKEYDFAGTKIVLPADIRRLRPSTMKVKRSIFRKTTGYIQSYSVFANLYNDPGEKKTRRFNFDIDEIFYLEYPLTRRTPVRNSLRLVKKSKQYWSFGIDRGRADNYPQDHHFNIENSRDKRASEEKRKYDFARAKIRRIFGLFLDGDLRISSEYDAFLVVEYAKTLRAIRCYLVECFNDQILSQIKGKNQYEVKPQLTLEGIDEVKITEIYTRYKNREITIKEMVDQLRSGKAL